MVTGPFHLSTFLSVSGLDAYAGGPVMNKCDCCTLRRNGLFRRCYKGFYMVAHDNAMGGEIKRAPRSGRSTEIARLCRDRGKMCLMRGVHWQRLFRLAGRIKNEGMAKILPNRSRVLDAPSFARNLRRTPALEMLRVLER